MDQDQGSTSSQGHLIVLSRDELTYEHFLEHCLKPNRPCILPRELVEDWPAFRLWSADLDGGPTLPDHELHPAFDRLEQLYGRHMAPVHIKLEGTDDVETREMSISDAIECMRRHKMDKTGQVYVKDYHLVRQQRNAQRREAYGHGGDTLPYTTPVPFADDWMNKLADPSDDDFRFCYAGSAGTRTPIHRDVYTSYSWSTNVVGRKRWTLFPPHVKHHLRRFPDHRTSQMATTVDDMEDKRQRGELGNVSDGKLGWAGWRLAFEQRLELEQEQGQTIFVPSDWHHEVVNLTDCISLNHNWCNSTNIASMYASMCEEVQDVEEALSDVKEMLRDADGQGWQAEWVATVQTVAEQDAGWAWRGFWTMVLRNLSSPACPSDLRPSQEYVRARLMPCIDDFEDRPEYALLSSAVRCDVIRCRALLEGGGQVDSNGKRVKGPRAQESCGLDSGHVHPPRLSGPGAQRDERGTWQGAS